MSYRLVKKGVLTASLMAGAGFASTASATFFFFVTPPAYFATEKTAKEIEENTHYLNKNTADIYSSTSNISDVTNKNFEIKKDFTWNDESQIINNYYGSDGGVIPLKTAVNTASYGNVDSYMASPGAVGDAKAAIRNQQDINNDLIEAVNGQSAQLNLEKKQLSDFAARTYDAQGLGNQMQIANSLAAQQTVQQMEARSLMVAQANAQAAAAQAEADRRARAYAKSQAFRKGLGNKNQLSFTSTSFGADPEN